MARPTYDLKFPKKGDNALVKRMLLEYFTRAFPCLVYKVFDAVASTTDTFYGDARRDARVFTAERLLNLDTESQGTQYLYEKFGIDRTKQVIFRACTPQLEVEGVVPKEGDEILWDGSIYEVAIVDRDSESYFGKSNESHILMLVANINPQGN